ncbi:glucose-6-phosphate dehydrogenase assembly protein OpcA [Flaviflexus huanghaiensis]|uniref:glucose-6-phosphate dehydrogenase assembly protein OpcA n=1 Tax=Flaviflexus huanghaiensis TaxID=1111473 RepID=UPI0015FCCF80|nr:glucose-6-phosphate dehydrogenase assembly protein OpcA [Flaviflexus huanghaiensis]
MILHLTSTTSADVAAELDSLRDMSGSVALGKVLTLIVIARNNESIEAALDAADGASLSHPCRIIAYLPDRQPDAHEATLSAELRVGGEAGVSEVIILRPEGGAGTDPASLLLPLLLPDTPVVVWWSEDAPTNPAMDPIGQLAQRRITNSIANTNPVPVLKELATNYTPGDTDMSWAGCTLWRGYLAAMLDEPPYEQVESVEVQGSLEHASTYLISAWLRLRLDVPVSITNSEGYGLEKVTMKRASGDLVLHREVGETAALLRRPGRADQRVNLETRTQEHRLIEELQRLDPDVAYGHVLEAFGDGIVDGY